MANLAVKAQCVSAFKAFLEANTVVLHRICPDDGMKAETWHVSILAAKLAMI